METVLIYQLTNTLYGRHCINGDHVPIIVDEGIGEGDVAVPTIEVVEGAPLIDPGEGK